MVKYLILLLLSVTILGCATETQNQKLTNNDEIITEGTTCDTLLNVFSKSLSEAKVTEDLARCENLWLLSTYCVDNADQLDANYSDRAERLKQLLTKFNNLQNQLK